MKFPHIKVPAAFLFAIAAAVLTVGPSSAHPHVWVTVETEVEFDSQKQLTGFKHKWTFDEYYTSFALAGNDANGDGVYSPEELKPLAQTNVEALTEFGYFTFPAVDGTKLPLKAPVDYHLEHTNNLLTLHFRLPLEQPVAPENVRKFSFQVYDPGYYVALTFDKKTPVRVNSEQPVQCAPFVKGGENSIKQSSLVQSLGENINPSSNVGSWYAQTVEFDCKQ